MFTSDLLVSSSGPKFPTSLLIFLGTLAAKTLLAECSNVFELDILRAHAAFQPSALKLFFKFFAKLFGLYIIWHFGLWLSIVNLFIHQRFPAHHMAMSSSAAYRAATTGNGQSPDCERRSQSYNFRPITAGTEPPEEGLSKFLWELASIAGIDSLAVESRSTFDFEARFFEVEDHESGVG